jgi:hypothetical protein
MDWQLINQIYNGLEALSPAAASLWVIFIMVTLCSAIVIMIGIGIGVGGLFASLGNLIPSKDKSAESNVSLWQTLKNKWTRKDSKSADHSAI